MAFLQSQIDLVNSLVLASTITSSQALDLLSSINGLTSSQITFIKSLSLTESDESALLAENTANQKKLETYMAQAEKYVIADDINSARKYVTLAEMVMSVLTDYELGNRSIKYREGIRFLKSSLNDLESRFNTASTKNKRIFIRYVGR